MTKAKSYREEVLGFSNAIEVSSAKRQRTKLFADRLQKPLCSIQSGEKFSGGTDGYVKAKPQGPSFDQ